nr:hypothetical protein [Tanacetum cinerariifolium]
MGYEKSSTKLIFYKAFFSSQWKFLIHTILQSLSTKRTSWNEFSTVMASAVICLSKGQRFNFSKYIFDSLKLEKINNVKSSKLRWLKKVGTSQRVESLDVMENVFNQGRIIINMDQDEGIELVADLEKDAEFKGRHADKQAEIYNIDLDHSSKGKKYDEILPIFQAKFDANMRFFFKSREEMEAEDEEIIKSINETPAQKAAKRRKQSEKAQEAEDLRKRLEIVHDEDDDVFVEATPLAQKVPIVDYQIVVIDNKPRYKIKRADDTHQLYISFTTLLKNFDREDLEALWKIFSFSYWLKEGIHFQDSHWNNWLMWQDFKLRRKVRCLWSYSGLQDSNSKNINKAFGVDAVKEIKENTKCVNAVNEELTAAKHKLMLKLKLFKNITAAEEMSK